ncbi:VOC family protein [Saccharopolyspora sp. HNM0983]|uniref:VOC family protein n=1 Tax=Saccharopolyspora montiporae TaxID=2781240 RepID=A0A929FYQ3_9PSEU|nr:VOC family protein [Saccharopolyspora sp. HNM0983]MBE9372937.1 VOC family protein [Saccharopolyspora sp. HNM0983]
MATRYAHTNLIAHDWQRLVAFYTEVFGCRAVGARRDLSGDWLARATAVPDARLSGQHLLLPGHGETGPTLEIFSYDVVHAQSPPVADRAGYGHLAFEVEDVSASLAAVLAHGGSGLGEPARTRVPGTGDLEVVYARDPEGNIVELQSWH